MGAVAQERRPAYASLGEIAKYSRPYPEEQLEGLASGLCLFSAAFLGHNDVVHFASAGIQTTCVDVDAGRLGEMRRLYPRSWQFVIADAWTYAHAAARQELAFDAVSVDSFCGDAMLRVLEDLTVWTDLANELVTVTVADGYGYTVPDGWEASELRRAPGVYWLVLTRPSS